MAVLLPFRAYRSRTPTLYIPGEETPFCSANAGYSQDFEPALFVYRQRFRYPGDGKESVRDGVMGLIDRSEALVLPHEETASDRVAACARNLMKPDSDPGTLWLWCADSDAALAPQLEQAAVPHMDVVDRFNCRHQIWRVNDATRIRDMQTALAGKPLFLADGHHRFAAGWNLATIQIRTPALRTLASHRLVFKASRFSLPDTQPVDDFERYLSSAPPGCLRCVVVTPGPIFRGFEVPRSVQVQRLLSGATVEPIRETAQAIAAVQTGRARMALLLPPFTVEQIEADARRGTLLPPKSTDFYPKLAAGLVVHRSQKENVTPPVIQRPGVL